ncbi:unnamed protein product [Schistosoma haematobium]|nr:unnamed protein product [Schistosoma haematobium]
MYHYFINCDQVIDEDRMNSLDISEFKNTGQEKKLNLKFYKNSSDNTNNYDIHKLKDQRHSYKYLKKK